MNTPAIASKPRAMGTGKAKAKAVRKSARGVLQAIDHMHLLANGEGLSRYLVPDLDVSKIAAARTHCFFVYVSTPVRIISGCICVNVVPVRLAFRRNTLMLNLLMRMLCLCYVHFMFRFTPARIGLRICRRHHFYVDYGVRGMGVLAWNQHWGRRGRFGIPKHERTTTKRMGTMNRKWNDYTDMNGM